MCFWAAPGVTKLSSIGHVHIGAHEAPQRILWRADDRSPPTMQLAWIKTGLPARFWEPPFAGVPYELRPRYDP